MACLFQNNELVDCQNKCDRQENVMTISEHSFPNQVFVESEEFWIVVRKLYWSCLDRPSRHGYKRPRITRKYPRICPFYDNYFYINPLIKNIVENLSLEEFLVWQKNNLTYNKLEDLTGMTSQETEEFQDAMLRYGEENLVHIVAYIGEPFMTVFLTDEAMSRITFVANMGGLLGLCMGFSLVSIMEIVYQLMISPFISWAEQKIGSKPSTENKPFLLESISSSVKPSTLNTNLVLL